MVLYRLYRRSITNPGTVDAEMGEPRTPPRATNARKVVIQREEGEFLGLGILPADNIRGVRVNHIVDDSPASKARVTSYAHDDDAGGPAIASGDVLLEINGNSCLDLSYDDVVTTLHEHRERPVELVVCSGLDLDAVTANGGDASVVRTPQRNGKVKLTVVSGAASEVEPLLFDDCPLDDSSRDILAVTPPRASPPASARAPEAAPIPALVLAAAPSPKVAAAIPPEPFLAATPPRAREPTAPLTPTSPVARKAWEMQEAPTVQTPRDDDEAALEPPSMPPSRSNSDANLPNLPNEPSSWSLTTLGIAVVAIGVLRWCRYFR
eukprot:m.259915 g.259915  ORF g.259915 m.259915 type:complete len:322 (-) comp26643_c0_seq18:1917-2882(-)